LRWRVGSVTHPAGLAAVPGWQLHDRRRTARSPPAGDQPWRTACETPKSRLCPPRQMGRGWVTHRHPCRDLAIAASRRRPRLVSPGAAARQAGLEGRVSRRAGAAVRRRPSGGWDRGGAGRRRRPAAGRARSAGSRSRPAPRRVRTALARPKGGTTTPSRSIDHLPRWQAPGTCRRRTTYCGVSPPAWLDVPSSGGSLSCAVVGRPPVIMSRESATKVSTSNSPMPRNTTATMVVRLLPSGSNASPMKANASAAMAAKREPKAKAALAATPIGRARTLQAAAIKIVTNAPISSRPKGAEILAELLDSIMRSNRFDRIASPRNLVSTTRVSSRTGIV
jgi:hypothetical protein